jgi:hypothetical protein
MGMLEGRVHVPEADVAGLHEALALPKGCDRLARCLKLEKLSLCGF